MLCAVVSVLTPVQVTEHFLPLAAQLVPHHCDCNSFVPVTI
jgi:hypothetical protein